MKAKKKELDVDAIGSQEPLTIEEEKAISTFLSQAKPTNKRRLTRKNRSENTQKTK